jgi:hypothetical protein
VVLRLTLSCSVFFWKLFSLQTNMKYQFKYVTAESLKLTEKCKGFVKNSLTSLPGMGSGNFFLRWRFHSCSAVIRDCCSMGNHSSMNWITTWHGIIVFSSTGTGNLGVHSEVQAWRRFYHLLVVLPMSLFLWDKVYGILRIIFRGVRNEPSELRLTTLPCLSVCPSVRVQ